MFLTMHNISVFVVEDPRQSSPHGCKVDALVIARDGGGIDPKTEDFITRNCSPV